MQSGESANGDGAGEPLERRQRWLAAAGLLSITGWFALFAGQYVQRVTNNLWADVAFSGWSAAVGHQLALGKRLYDDVTLPLPPGSFVLLSWLERAAGRGGPRLLHEVWVCATSHLVMALLAYAIAKPFAGRRVALFSSAASLTWICGWAKELAYDHLAEVWAWGTMALLVQAWVREPGRCERRWLFLAGIATGTTYFWKQSTATGVLLGGGVGLGYLALVERSLPGALRERLRGALAYSVGTLGGFFLTVGAVAASSGSPGGFLRASFVDGVALKGGTSWLAGKTLWGALVEPLVKFPLVAIVLLSAVAFRIAQRPGGFAIGGEGGPRPESLQKRHIAGLFVVTAAVFGWSALLLATGTRRAPGRFDWLTSLSFGAVQSGLCFAALFFFGNLGRSAFRTPRAFNATALAITVLASAVSMSLTTFDPLGENNATIVLVTTSLFLAVERVGIPGLSWIALLVAMGTPLGSKLPRAQMAMYPVGDASFFHGMRVNGDGREVLRAAAQARVFAGRKGSVLVLPEDPSLAALVGRPRPDLCGAIVFPDQYPARCLERDVRFLDRHLPRVLILRPTAPDQLLPVMRQWNRASPAEALMSRFLSAHAKDYERIGSYRTRWGLGTATLEVWTLRGVEVTPPSESR